MKVLMFGWEFPPHISGGLGTACLGLTNGLSSFEDIEVTFVLPKVYGNENKPDMKLIDAGEVILSGRKIKKHREFEKMKLHEFEQHISAYITPALFEKTLNENLQKAGDTMINTPFGKLEFTGKYGAGLFEEISRYGLVASEIAKNEPHDIIHAHDWLTFQAGIEAKKASGKPLVVHIHATEYDRCGDTQNKMVLDIEKRGMEIADKVITVSDFTRNIVIQKYKICPLKVVTVHNAVEPANRCNTRNLWKIGINDKIVTFLGRITSQKGPGYFVEAANSVLKKMDNVRFVMAGEGDLKEKIIKYVAKLRISDKFHFTGFLRGDEVYRMYGVSDLYIMPSVSEPFGISPLEAIHSNVPVIISKQSGVSEVIKHAIKVDYWDVDAMADAIYGILSYTALSNLLRNKGRLEVEKIKWTDVAGKIKEIYYQLYCMKAG
jgi:glycosyltransferase involved in cell wall biosynthesis